MRIGFFRLALVLTLLSNFALAKRVDVKWGAIAGAEKYEYQLSRTENFGGDLVRSGTTRNIYFVTDLGPGVYFLRVRGLDESGQGGAWSQAARILVEASALEIRKPVSNETIELFGPQSPFFVEWTAVEGASDYQLQVRKGSTVRNIISPTNSARLDGLDAGAWVLSVSARIAGQVIQKSNEQSFRIVVNARPKPVIYSPIAGEAAVAWDNFKVRWLNNAKSPRSEVVIRRLGEKNGVISREVVNGKSETLTPRLPPGSYQISVRNLFDGASSEYASVDIITKEDAMGYHAQYLGVSVELVLGPTMGITGFRNSGYDSDVHKQSSPSGEMDFRILTDITQEWSLELGLGARGDRFFDRLSADAVSDSFVDVEATRIQLQALLGARYKLNLLGPTKPIWLRGWLFWRGVEMPSGGQGIQDGVATSNDPKFHTSNARILGTGLGGEIRWGSYRSRWDAIGRLDLLIPWFANGAKLASQGVAMFPPTIELRIIPRIKISPEYRLGVVLGGRYEALSFKQKTAQNSRLYSYRAFVMPTISWDL